MGLFNTEDIVPLQMFYNNIKVPQICHIFFLFYVLDSELRPSAALLTEVSSP